jgi:hypothetical protein
MQNGKNNAKLNKAPSKFSPSLGENDGKFISTWNSGIYKFTSFLLKIAVSIHIIY